ncbi:BAG family molecular chaperone regulator [Sporobolomyces salmoneus]|uniref:BAG family molecular chaperone regulator n=1 Tax=Sporobolomyces salmoneus TaxID=183962 RepID=UPI00317A0CF1
MLSFYPSHPTLDFGYPYSHTTSSFYPVEPVSTLESPLHPSFFLGNDYNQQRQLFGARQLRQQQLRQAILEQARQEQEEERRRREVERALTLRQEMIRRSRQAERERARAREETRLRHHQLRQAQEWRRRQIDEEAAQTGDLFDALIESLLPSHTQIDHASHPVTCTPSSATDVEPPVLASSTPLSPQSTSLLSSTELESECPISADDDTATLYRDQALEKLSSLASSFFDRQSNFVAPTSFTFESSPTPPFTTPRLAFGSANSQFLSYEDYLVKLLSELDAVESRGDRQIKKERKALVKRVEAELERLDEMRERAWEQEKQSQVPLPSSNADVSTSSLNEDDDSLPAPLPPLTEEAVASLSSRFSSRSLSDSDASSFTSSTLTSSTSSNASQVDLYIAEMLQRAQKLGEEAERVETASKPFQRQSVAIAV